MVEVIEPFIFFKVNFYLSTVKSYGTEDRHTDRPVPLKEEIFEYIIFRGSDIKDITVSEPPKPQHGLPCDPAIVQVCGPGSSNLFFFFFPDNLFYSSKFLCIDELIPFVCFFFNKVVT